LALSQSSGNIQTVIDGTLAKRYQAGFSAESGVKAALLAKRGITGPTNVFEGRCGFFKLYESGAYHRALVTEGLGTQFEGANSSIKPFPCAREHHGAVAAALQLFSGGVRSDDIESVVVRLPPNAFALSGKRFSRSESHTVAAAMGSAAYGVAVALIKGALTLDDFQQEALLRADVVELADRIQIEEDRTVTDAKTLVPQVVVVRRRGVTRVEEAISRTMPGSPEHPLTTDELERKLVGCFAYSAHPSRPQAREGLVAAIENLESMTNIRELAALTT
jgi:2-methylcitrate dehydratase PrpD